MSLNPTDYIWMDGELVEWDEANVHILTHTLHYGLGVFEGIRCYETEEGPAVFRLDSHMERFQNSANLVKMDLPYSVDELIDAVRLTIRENDVNGCYIRPIAYYGYGKMGLNPQGAPIQVAIAVWPWGSYLGEEGLKKGVRTTITDWKKITEEIMPPHSKTVANYANSILAKLDALDRGYDEAILLNLDGNIAEGPGENIFIVENGKLITPPITSNVLEGITRDSIIQIAKDKDIPVIEEDFGQGRLLDSDEAFFTGTAAEVTPIREVDDNPIGSKGRGEITKELQKTFFDIVEGKLDQYNHWLDYID